MSDDLYDLVKEVGEATNFSVVFTSASKRKKAKKIAARFAEFAQECADEGISMHAGFGEVPVIGQASYIEFRDSEASMVAIAVPYEFIEVESEQ